LAPPPRPGPVSILSWETYAPGRAHINEKPVNFDRPVQFWSPPEDQRAASLRSMGYLQRGEIALPPAGYCSSAVQRAGAKGGIRGFTDGGMGHAWSGDPNTRISTRLKQIGYTPTSTPRPGDIAIYTDGRNGHIGWVTQGGQARSYSPQGREQAGSLLRGHASGLFVSRQPTAYPLVDPLALALGQPTVVTPEMTWDFIRSARQPGLSEQERSVLASMSNAIPEVGALVQFVETGELPELY
jgi:hypothetical protein